MKLTKATHKAFLYSLFLDGNTPKTFPIDKLMIASSTAKKLVEGSERTDDQIRFSVGDIEFSAEEWVLLKELFKGKTTGTIGEADIITELTEIFVK